MIDSFRGDYSFLSNFHPCTIEYEGITYPSVEHAYQAAKTLDLDDRRRIATLTAAQAKRAGKQVAQREDWTKKTKLLVMEDLLVKKFWHTPLSEKLLATGDEELVEGNWWNDIFWGKCKGIGANNLGKLLMHIRSQLRKSPALEYRP